MATWKCLGRTEESQHEFIMVFALSCSCGNLKTVLKVWSQLLENFHYHGSVRNAKLLNWTVFDRLLPPPRGRQNSRPRYKLWFRRAPVLPCLRFQQTEHQNWSWLVLSAGMIHWGSIVKAHGYTEPRLIYRHCLRPADLKGQTSPAAEKSYHSVHLRLFIY